MRDRRIWDGRKTHAFRTRLLDWYDRHRRELPWRSLPTPYRVWISEIMLQQTQVKTVVPYFEEFVSHFPDVHSLAAATEQEVVRLWAGLGYYSRARNIHRAARDIVDRHAGRFPETFDALLRLPGIGRYTAGAIRSIAFNRRAPIVDGNVRRVIARLHGIEQAPPDSFCWEQADAWVDDARPSDFNQAVMELGALVCTPSSPACLLCPVSTLCAARREGIQDRIPSPARRTRETRVELAILWLDRNGKIVLAKNGTGFVPGDLCLPTAILDRNEKASAAAEALSCRIAGRPTALVDLGTVRHAITHRRIRGHVFAGKVRQAPGFPAVLPAAVPAALTSSLFRKAAALALRASAGDAARP